MQINITGRQMDVTDALRDRVQKELSRLQERVADIAQAHVVLESAGKHLHRCAMRLDAGAGVVNAKSEAEDMYAAIADAAHKARRQLTQAADKRHGKS